MEADVRAVREADLPAADHLFRLAFGTFFGAPDPLQFAGDSDWVRPRWRVDPSASFAIAENDLLVGANFTARWGSVGFFGPLCVRPERWNGGVGQRLLEPTMAKFAEWKLSHAGLFTFAQSPKHISLYIKFGFWPRALTAVMEKSVSPRTASGWSRLSALPPSELESRLADVRQLTDSVWAGLDVTADLRTVLQYGFGDGIVIDDGDRVAGIALCHLGAGSEAGSDSCYVKFAAVRSGPRAQVDFGRLLDACEAFASFAGLGTLAAGTSLAREGAYRELHQRGFRTDLQGVCMHRPNEAGYHHAGAWVIDDWR
jgi:GNAT superfamily N-acetyltransferase